VDVDLEIYRGENQEYAGDLLFPAILRRAAMLLVGDVARGTKIDLYVEGPADAQVYAGPPEIRNLKTDEAYGRLQVIKDEEVLEERRLLLVDLLGPVLAEDLTATDPDQTWWAFRLRRKRMATLVIVGQKIADLLTGEERPVPEVQGSVDVDPGERRHQPFTLTPMARAEEARVRPEELGLDRDHLGRVNILMSAKIHEQLLRGMPLSDNMEEGGFLLGRVSKADEESYLVDVTHVTPAHRSGAGMVHFTFTGDSFLAVARLLEERGEAEELVGWYHTHLFGVDFGMGLSSIDVDLHLATFQRPWQVAALINIRRRSRVLRFYGRDEKKLREYEQWVCDDSGKYRPARAVLGGH